MNRKFETAAPDRYGLLKEFAKHNRQEMTESERILWNTLRKEIKSYKFRRQHPIGDYIADFLCVQLKLVIEVDGEYHHTPEQQAKDQWRTDYLESKGYRVIRFSNEEVNTDPKEVIRQIKEELINIEDSYE
ncbi:MAG: endonuclease domain-containing protein [Prevotella sp.]|jgi:very-short-patch-repair endonuclease|nr:endonuclease domain-containing protein [Prevotella sp.]